MQQLLYDNGSGTVSLYDVPIPQALAGGVGVPY